jgi:acyl-CoA reductase-like NAD-dependent aldehyde dehydrogenase
MVLDSRVDYLSFTGSPGVGWHLKALVPKKPVTLELGGNAFAIIDASADLNAALPKITLGAFGYAGQICISVQHVLVHSSLYDEAVERLRDLTYQVPCGDPQDSTVVCGPVIDESAADRIMSWIAEAKKAGAEVAVGGKRVGNLIEPTLLTRCPEATRIGCEEVFGPVLTIDPFDDLLEAFSRVNRSRYGIHAGLFTKEGKSVSQALDALQTVGLVVDDVPTVRFDKLPYGGVKDSGFGLEGVPYAFEEMTQPKSVVRRLPG